MLNWLSDKEAPSLITKFDPTPNFTVLLFTVLFWTDRELLSVILIVDSIICELIIELVPVAVISHSDKLNPEAMLNLESDSVMGVDILIFVFPVGTMNAVLFCGIINPGSVAGSSSFM